MPWKRCVMVEPPVRILRATSTAELDRVHLLRVAVFVREQGVPLAEEVDGRDHEPGAVHLLAVQEANDLGTARLLVEGHGRVHLTRVAVAHAARGRGVGRTLMRAVEEIAAREHAVAGKVQVELSAQESALGFYRRLGYTIVSGRYLEAGIRHADAVKEMTEQTVGADQTGGN